MEKGDADAGVDGVEIGDAGRDGGGEETVGGVEIVGGVGTVDAARRGELREVGLRSAVDRVVDRAGDGEDAGDVAIRCNVIALFILIHSVKSNDDCAE